MVKSGTYVPAAKLLCSKKAERRQAEAVWRVLLRPEEATKQWLSKCFFEQEGPGRTVWVHHELETEPDMWNQSEEYQDSFDYEGAHAFSHHRASEFLCR